jgi:general secretion pathway protein A
MYESFFRLHHAPFNLTPDPNLIVLTDAHAEALSNLEYGIARQKGLILLIGVPGAGKTIVIRTALQRQSPQVKWVYLNNPTLTRSEFLELLAARFDLSADAGRSKAAFLRELESLVRKRRSCGEATVLIVDEAQSLSFELLEEIRLLANIEEPEQKLLTIVLAGQPSLAERLEDPALLQLKQRIELRYELRSLTPVETAAYLIFRIERAGGVAANLFTRDAVEAIHTESGGVPRTISVLADNALLSAFAMGEARVIRKTVVEVAAELRIRATHHADHNSLVARASASSTHRSAVAESSARADTGPEPVDAGGNGATPSPIRNGHGLQPVASANGGGAQRPRTVPDDVGRPMFLNIQQPNQRVFFRRRRVKVWAE